ncbi:unnamed protein product [Penicillium roqueforti FM164]|uniref:Genomic scaffold, ProqFM164S02 n=1 Tax=Penicillium roqueforti (strain FM164) TaxID=1365484 RepID=W6Q7W1_PENRF|nr:unnamed protein product [Penicillium roqueforti FM164]
MLVAVSSTWTESFGHSHSQRLIMDLFNSNHKLIAYDVMLYATPLGYVSN